MGISVHDRTDEAVVRPLPRHDRKRCRVGAATQQPAGVHRAVPLLFLAFGAALVPWTLYLGVSLPATATSLHADIFWVGFDVALIAAMSRTGYLTLRGQPEAALPAVVTATLLIVDAWLDITSAKPGWPLTAAVARAVCFEIPIALLALYVAHRVAGVAFKENIMQSTIESARSQESGRRAGITPLSPRLEVSPPTNEEPHGAAETTAYSPEEEALVEERLKNLGYL